MRRCSASRPPRFGCRGRSVTPSGRTKSPRRGSSVNRRLAACFTTSSAPSRRLRSGTRSVGCLTRRGSRCTTFACSRSSQVPCSSRSWSGSPPRSCRFLSRQPPGCCWRSGPSSRHTAGSCGRTSSSRCSPSSSRSRSIAPRCPRRRGRAAVVGASAAAGSLTHYFFAFTLVAGLAWLWFEPTARASRRRVTAAIVVALAACSPWLPLFVAQFRHDRYSWIGPFDARETIETPLRIFSPLIATPLTGCGLRLMARRRRVDRLAARPTRAAPGDARSRSARACRSDLGRRRQRVRDSQHDRHRAVCRRRRPPAARGSAPLLASYPSRSPSRSRRSPSSSSGRSRLRRTTESPPRSSARAGVRRTRWWSRGASSTIARRSSGTCRIFRCSSADG